MEIWNDIFDNLRRNNFYFVALSVMVKYLDYLKHYSYFII
jgi:hypothetical protein